MQDTALPEGNRSGGCRQRGLAPDAVVVATAHRNNLDYRALVDHAPLVLDTKNIVATQLGLTLPLPENLKRL